MAKNKLQKWLNALEKVGSVFFRERALDPLPSCSHPEHVLGAGGALPRNAALEEVASLLETTTRVKGP